MQHRGKLGRLGVAALGLAIVAGGLVHAGSSVKAQAPGTVPIARFYGLAKDPNGTTPVNTSIQATIGSQVCSATQANVNGSAVLNDSSYFVDIQAVPGCTTPGATITFTAGSLRAKETGTLPDLPGTAVHLNLTLQAPPTPTAAAPTPPAPPTPARTATQAPPPASATAPRPATPAATPARPVVQQAPGAPKGPVAQGPKAGPAYAAPATAPRLPNTGTGGLLDQQTSSSSLTGWALAVIVLAALGVSASGLVAYRRR